MLLLPCSALALSLATVSPASHAPACIDLAVVDTQPARLELGPWLQVGGKPRGARGTSASTWSLGAGLELTHNVARFGRRDYGGAHELRLGPWLGVESDTTRARLEAGLSLVLTQEQHAQWGTMGLRLGGGVDDLGRAHGVGVLSYGVRRVPGRVQATRGPCDPVPPPPDFAMASGARLYVALRQGLQASAVSAGPEVSFGIELDPTWLLPPYSLNKWAGAAR